MTPARDLGHWAPAWAAERLEQMDFINECRTGGGAVIVVERKMLPTVRIAAVAVEVLDQQVLEDVLDQSGSICFVLNVPKEARITGAAIESARRAGIAIGDMGDTIRALRDEPNPASYVHADTKFIERGLRQHSQISSWRLLDRGRYEVATNRGYTVRVVVTRTYEVTADAVRTEFDRFDGDLDAYVTANPNAREVSPQALQVGAQIGLKVLRWSEFLGALNRPWT